MKLKKYYNGSAFQYLIKMTNDRDFLKFETKLLYRCICTNDICISYLFNILKLHHRDKNVIIQIQIQNNGKTGEKDKETYFPQSGIYLYT